MGNSDILRSEYDLRSEGKNMPFNCKGDLYKIEIVKKLQGMGFDVKSVNALNKITDL